MIRYLVLILFFVDITFSVKCINRCTCQSEGLETLICSSRNLNQFPTGIDNSTQFLRLEDNKIDQIPGNLSKLLPNLTMLDMSENIVTRLHPKTFANFKKLQTVTLLNNKVTTIDDHIFEGFSNTEMTLNLRGNNISKIHQNAFAGLYADGDIDISRNSLTAISPNTFDDLRQLFVLSVAFNHLESIPSGLFKNQGHLYLLSLRGNKISVLNNDVFEGLSSLETLDLASNYLKKLPKEIFRKNKMLKTINLDSNRLHYPPTGLPEKVQITLKNNPITCDCQLKNMLSDSSYKSKLKDIDQVICANDATRTTAQELKRINCETTTLAPTTSAATKDVHQTTSSGGHLKVTAQQRTSKKTRKIENKDEYKKWSWPIVLGIVLAFLVLAVVSTLFIYLFRRKILLKICGTTTLSRSKREKPSRNSTDDFEYHIGWNGATTAMLTKTEGNI